MNDSKNDGLEKSAVDSEAQLPTLTGGSAQDVVVVVNMRPDRVIGGLTDEDEAGKKARPGKPVNPPVVVSKSFHTSSWFFASDFLDRVAEISAEECAGLHLRPVKVEIDFALDAKAYRHVDLILDSFDIAYRGL